MGGDLKSAWQGARGGFISGSLFAGANYLSRGWDWDWYGRIAAQATAGGLSNKLQGRSFSDGFMYNFAYSSMKEWTDWQTLLGGQYARDLESGKLRSDGTAPVKTAYGAFLEKSQSWFEDIGLTMSPQSNGVHIYEKFSGLRNLIVDTSKVHDFLNGWNYRDGYYISRGPVFDTLFDVYNFAGMVPAAVFASSSPRYGTVVHFPQ